MRAPILQFMLIRLPPGKMWLCSLIILVFCNVLEASIYIYDGDESIEQFSDSELPFAQPIKKYGLEGAIVMADPPDACSKIAAPPNTTFSMNWFVLIAGNFCDFNTKVVNADAAGFSAAVIYGFKINDDSYRPGSGCPNISAVTIRTNSGLIIKDNYLYSFDSRYTMYIFPYNTYFHVLTFFLFIAGVMGIIMIVLVSFVVVRIAYHTHLSSRTRLTKRLLNQLQTSRFRKGDPYETCAICLEDYQHNDKLRILPCQHGYHVKCIDPWLTNNKGICPVCKQEVLPNELSCSESDVENRSETAPLLQHSRAPASYNVYRALPDTL